MGNLCTTSQERLPTRTSDSTTASCEYSVLPVSLPPQEKAIHSHEEACCFSQLPPSMFRHEFRRHLLTGDRVQHLLAEHSLDTKLTQRILALLFNAIAAGSDQVERAMFLSTLLLLSAEPAQTKASFFFDDFSQSTTISAEDIEKALALIFEVSVVVTPRLVTEGRASVQNYQNFLRSQKQEFLKKHCAFFTKEARAVSKETFLNTVRTQGLEYLFQPTLLRMHILAGLSAL